MRGSVGKQVRVDVGLEDLRGRAGQVNVVAGAVGLRDEIDGQAAATGLEVEADASAVQALIMLMLVPP